jgi:hypothetical protein
MSADTRPVRRIGKRTNRVKFGKQPNGTLFPVAMLTTSPQISSLRQIADYHLKASDKHFCWMAVNNPGTAPFFETASRKNTLNAPNHNDSVLKGVNDHRGNNVEEFWGC